MRERKKIASGFSVIKNTILLILLFSCASAREKKYDESSLLPKECCDYNLISGYPEFANTILIDTKSKSPTPEDGACAGALIASSKYISGEAKIFSQENENNKFNQFNLLINAIQSTLRSWWFINMELCKGNKNCQEFAICESLKKNGEDVNIAHNGPAVIFGNESFISGFFHTIKNKFTAVLQKQQTDQPVSMRFDVGPIY